MSLSNIKADQSNIQYMYDLLSFYYLNHIYFMEVESGDEKVEMTT